MLGTVCTRFIVACLGQCVEVAGVPDFPELLVGRNRLGHRELPADIRSPAAFVVASGGHTCVCADSYWGVSCHARVCRSLFCESVPGFGPFLKVCSVELCRMPVCPAQVPWQVRAVTWETCS